LTEKSLQKLIELQPVFYIQIQKCGLATVLPYPHQYIPAIFCYKAPPHTPFGFWQFNLLPPAFYILATLTSSQANRI
jgi:hypothetical protein